ncbi:putative quinol monooxygenase [Bradyrhizobium uaiense]|uniref:putative quinol monooxygenase n=1 Tax=Bradyrhizobium uaiense TaxID=2594946 RepID=UPI001F44EBF1|nr:antibiotic biosynthesis monooxygenase [Bradyrhizobium uaiense]
MLTITAVVRAKDGHESTMRQALLDVVAHVRATEPSTVGYHVSQDASDPCVFAGGGAVLRCCEADPRWRCDAGLCE